MKNFVFSLNYDCFANSDSPLETAHTKPWNSKCTIWIRNLVLCTSPVWHSRNFMNQFRKFCFLTRFGSFFELSLTDFT